jgi:hypothetical protein
MTSFPNRGFLGGERALLVVIFLAIDITGYFATQNAEPMGENGAAGVVAIS